MIRERIWEELKMSKSNVECIHKYNDIHRRWNRWYDFAIAVCAAIGAFGYLWDAIVPFISTLAIGISQLVKNLFPSVLQREEELSSLDTISDFYLTYMSRLEHLFYKLDYEIESEEVIANQFFALKETECEKQSKMNKLVRKISEKEHKRIDKETTDYVNRVYFNKYPNTENQTNNNENNV